VKLKQELCVKRH